MADFSKLSPAVQQTLAAVQAVVAANAKLRADNAALADQIGAMQGQITSTQGEVETLRQAASDAQAVIDALTTQFDELYSSGALQSA